MIKVEVEHVENHVDGCAQCKIKDSEDSFSINLLSLYEEGIRVYHDGRLEMHHLDMLFRNPVYLDEITINITGWFHIHYKLTINVKEEYTEIKIINNI